MSHKKAIIASDLPVIREVLNRRNSILVKYNDIKLNNIIQNLEKIQTVVIVKEIMIHVYYKEIYVIVIMMKLYCKMKQNAEKIKY